MLERGGHQVHTYTRHNDEIDESKPIDLLRTVNGLRFSARSHRELTKVIRQVDPDVVHFHNTFPLISPSGYLAARACGKPVVQTVHNYRLVCAAGTHFRAGGPCEKCTPHQQWSATRYGCVRNSRAASWLVGSALANHWAIGTYHQAVDLFIALTEFAAARLIAAGIEPSKVIVSPNVVDIDATSYPIHKARGVEPYAVFMGRLSVEKGLHTLLDAWASRPPWRLKILGAGPLLTECQRRIYAENLPVDCLGMLPRAKAIAVMMGASAVVVPSLWFEGMPMVILEAWSQGIPVIGSSIGGVAEMLRDGRGLTFTPGDAAALLVCVRALAASPALGKAVQKAATAEFQSRHSASAGLERLEAVYRRLTASSPPAG